MANFLITSPSAVTTGTDGADLFSLRELQGTTVYGLAGNDILTGVQTTAASAARLNAGAGNDTVTLANNLSNSEVLLGSGDDVFSSNKHFVSAVARGGSGADSIGFDGLLRFATINGNDGADVISANLSADSNGFVAGGKGRDTVHVILESAASALTVNGGAGHDSINFEGGAASDLDALVVNGGDGFDSIVFDASASIDIRSSFNIDGGDLGDQITFQGGISGGTDGTVQGGAGADTLSFGSINVASGYFFGGAGNDSIVVTGIFSAGTINGGAGADSITLSGSVNAGIAFGGDAADVFSLGVFTAGAGGTTADTAVTFNRSNLGYASFSDSNYAAYDSVSATNVYSGIGTATGSIAADLFTVHQDVVSAFTATGGNALVSIANGTATFTSTVDAGLTARLEILDGILTEGAAVAFADGLGTNFFFVQGGAQASGIADDLVVKGAQTVNKLSIVGGTAISLRTYTAW